MTQAYAIVGPDGQVITDTISEDPDLLEWQGKPITPVTIIPDADKVQWAARVLLDWLDQPMTEGGMTPEELNFMKATGGIGEAAYDALEAAIRALAGGDTP